MKNNILNKVMGAVVAMATVASIATAQDNKGIQWDGFGSAYFSLADGDVIPSDSSDRRVNFRNNSNIGLNLHAKMDEQFSATAQLIALGREEFGSDTFDVKVQWGFVTYAPASDWNVQAGRLLYPTWLAAEYINIGYLLPYREMPRAITGVAPFTAFDGLAVNKVFNTAIGRLTVSASGGTPPVINVDSTAATVQAVPLDFVGLSATLEGDGWTGKVAVTDSKARSTTYVKSIGLTVYDKARPQGLSLGFKYDKNNMVVWSEYLASKSADSESTISNGVRYIGEASGGYVLAGYRVGKWLPRYTYSSGTQKYGIAPAGGVDGGFRNSSESHTFGVNYELGAQAVAKVEYEALHVSKGTGVGTAGATASDRTDGSAVYAGVDFTF